MECDATVGSGFNAPLLRLAQQPQFGDQQHLPDAAIELFNFFK